MLPGMYLKILKAITALVRHLGHMANYLASLISIQ